MARNTQATPEALAMAIDIRDYEKYSGRKGDPMMRRGSALAGSEKQKASTASARSRNTGGDVILAGYRGWWIGSIVLSIFVLIVVLLSRIF